MASLTCQATKVLLPNRTLDRALISLIDLDRSVFPDIPCRRFKITLPGIR